MKESPVQLKESYDISRYPHFDQIKDSLLGRSGRIDIRTYLNGRNGDGETNALTDLPDNLQQLQQQLLEVNIPLL